jgi:hypothetical protein
MPTKGCLPPSPLLCPQVADVIGTFRMLSQLPSDSLGAYIISMAHTASDVLAVVLLQKECGGGWVSAASACLKLQWSWPVTLLPFRLLVTAIWFVTCAACRPARSAPPPHHLPTAVPSLMLPALLALPFCAPCLPAWPPCSCAHAACGPSV